MIEVKIVGNYGKNKVESIAEDKYYMPIVDGRELNLIAETYDIALILGLQYKYCGRCSQFAKFACRMLNIPSLWAG